METVHHERQTMEHLPPTEKELGRPFRVLGHQIPLLGCVAQHGGAAQCGGVGQHGMWNSVGV